MAVTVDQASLGAGNSTATLTTTMATSGPVAPGALIVVDVARWAATTTSTIALAGGSLTWTKDHEVASGNLKIAQFSGFAPAGLAAATTLTATHGGALGGGLDCIMSAVSRLGVDTSGTVTAFNGGTASAVAWTSSAVAGNSGDALIGAAFRDGGTATSSSPGASEVERSDTNIAGQNETLVVEDILSIAGSTALTGNWSATANHVAIAVAYKAAGGGGAPVVKQLSALGVG